MSFKRINKCFYEMNDVYLDLCERQDIFNNNSTAKKKEELENIIKKFKAYLNNYEMAVKGVWISDKWGGR